VLAPLLLLCGCGSSGSSESSTHTLTLTAPLGGVQRIPIAPAIAAARPNSSHPNIVFVLTDDLSWNLVPYMPHVLAMERRGETFANYFVTDSLCCPSRASIFTGRFPHNTHIVSNSPPYGGFPRFHELDEEQQTFALALWRRGYMTAMMGKYLNGYLPNGGEGVPASYVPPGWSEWDVAGNGYPEYGYTLNENGHPTQYGSQPQEYLTDVLARKGLHFIDRAAAARRPFLLELSTFAPHSPYIPAPRDEGDFPGLMAPRTPAFDAPATGAPAWLAPYAPLEAQQIEQIDHQFRLRAQAVQAVDNMIAQIEALLTARGLAQSTYLVFSSDNGLHMGEHRLMPGKQTAFDTDIHVPLIVIGPGVARGRTVSEMTENIDLCPTFERLAGAPVGAGVDGHSLVALLRGRPLLQAWRREILVEHHGPVLAPADPDLPERGAGNPTSYEALRTPTSLYVEYTTGEREYYDLRTDPFELHNIAGHLAPAHERLLHRALTAIEHCVGQRSCWRAQHLPT